MIVLVARAGVDGSSCSSVNLGINVTLLALLLLLDGLVLGRRRVVVAAASDLIVRGNALLVGISVDPASVKDVAGN